MRKIAIITGSRADYGILYWVIKHVHDDPDLELQLLITGMHLSPEHGLTGNEIEKDGFPIADRVDIHLLSDTPASISASIGHGLIGFAKAYERLKPDIILALGDRFEIFSAVAAAVPFVIPVAHIHGGETTEGSVDESFRHAITKMSHLHFAATEEYRNRIIQMGESPERVYCFGAPGLDNVIKTKILDRKELSTELGVPESAKLGIVTYHPVTVEKGMAGFQINELIEALKAFPGIFWVFTLPNADAEGSSIANKMIAFASTYPRSAKAFSSLGSLRYFSLMAHASLMVGNSSSGLIEAPSFRLPVVNIGTRQSGRIRGKNVIDVTECSRQAIVNAIDKVLDEKFSQSLSDCKNPYGCGDASYKIIEQLKNIDLGSGFLRKRFYHMGV